MSVASPAKKVMTRLQTGGLEDDNTTRVSAYSKRKTGLSSIPMTTKAGNTDGQFFQSFDEGNTSIKTKA